MVCTLQDLPAEILLEIYTYVALHLCTCEPIARKRIPTQIWPASKHDITSKFDDYMRYLSATCDEARLYAIAEEAFFKVFTFELKVFVQHKNGPTARSCRLALPDLFGHDRVYKDSSFRHNGRLKQYNFFKRTKCIKIHVSCPRDRPVYRFALDHAMETSTRTLKRFEGLREVMIVFDEYEVNAKEIRDGLTQVLKPEMQGGMKLGFAYMRETFTFWHGGGRGPESFRVTINDVESVPT